MQQENEKLRKHIRNVKIREKRAKNTLDDLLKHLAEKEISAQLELQLST